MFRLIERNGLKYYKIEEFENTGIVKHCFTTRHGGVSSGAYKSMNLRVNSDDAPENIRANYRIICDEIGVDANRLVLSNQVHENNVVSVGKKDCGNGLSKPQCFKSADALITGETGVPIVIFGADCVPVYFLDVKERVIALAHSGWRGTIKDIAAKTAQKMINEYNSKPENIIAAIGPSIGVCHYEVDDEPAEAFRKKFGDSVLEKHTKFHVNMQKAIKMQLFNMGVKNVTDSGICTFCENDMFFSHRKNGNCRGVMAAITELTDRK